MVDSAGGAALARRRRTGCRLVGWAQELPYERYSSRYTLHSGCQVFVDGGCVHDSDVLDAGILDLIPGRALRNRPTTHDLQCPGHSCDIDSSNLVNQDSANPSCNLVALSPSGRVLFQTRTRGTRPVLRVNPDGNVVLLSGSRVLWHARTAGQGTAALVAQDDGNVVLYRDRDGRAVWSTRSGRTS